MVSAIKWFNSLKDKYLMKFIVSYQRFLPFYTQDLMKMSLDFANEYITGKFINK